MLDQDATQQQQAHAGQLRGPTMPVPPKRERGWHNTATIVLSFLTLVVLGFNAYLVTKAQELTRDDQRAWVGAIRPTVPMVPDVPVKATITLKNFGHGPARRLTSSFHVRSRPSSEVLSPDVPADGSYDSCGALPPGEKWTAQSASPPVLTKGQIDDINSGAYSLYAFGEVDYEDAFRRPCRTTYAYKWLPDIQTWQVLSKHNEMD